MGFPGLSLPDPKTVWDLQQYVEFVLDKVPKKWKTEGYFIFGHSFGGRVAIKTAAANTVDGLKGIIVCAPGGLSRPAPIKRLIFMALAKAGKIFMVYMPFAHIYRRFLYKLARQHDYEKTQGVMKEVFKKIVSEELMPLAEKIHIPTLIFWDKNDRVVPFEDGRQAHRKIRSSKIVLFDHHGGHKLPYFFGDLLALEIEKWFGKLK